MINNKQELSSFESSGYTINLPTCGQVTYYVTMPIYVGIISHG